MITAGSQIDAAFSAFGTSAMAAAALGNTVSDVAGIKAGGFIEMAAAKLGLPDPRQANEQLEIFVTKRTVDDSYHKLVLQCQPLNVATHCS